MSQSQASTPRSITLDELIALNDEIAALSRAGVPLEPALGQLGSELPGRLGRIATAVAQRGQQGQSLSEVLADDTLHLPPVYRAVVEAGLRAGRLPAALEALAGSIGRLAETRRTVAVAMLYPVIVLMVAWSLFAFFTSRIAPVMLTTFDKIDVPGSSLFTWMVDWGRYAEFWLPAGLAVLGLAAGGWGVLARRSGVIESRAAGWLLGWLPWVGRTLRWTRAAAFADLLALLVESRVPLPEAVELAAAAGGDRRLAADARSLADALRRGEPLSAAGKLAEFPPLLRWMIAAGGREATFVAGLRHAADTYHRRARHEAELARLLLPVALTLVIGGGTVLLYGLTLFLPYTSILRGLSDLM